MNETFEQFITQERARLHAERDAIIAQQRDLKVRLDGIEKEFEAIAAYESAKTGKGGKQRPDARRTRKGSKRNEIIAVIRAADGLTRGEVLDRMGLKGDKAGELSVSNALTALTKNGTVHRRDGRYRFAA